MGFTSVARFVTFRPARFSLFRLAIVRWIRFMALENGEDDYIVGDLAGDAAA